jgi:CubicO group peptidase (beta-lactamase class C family)
MKDGRLTPVTAGPFAQTYRDNPVQASGGGGLVTTAGDYARFASMLVGHGSLGGNRILSAASVDMMMSSHISSTLLTQNFGAGLERIKPGYEFGVNGVVVTDPAKANVALGKGSYLWGGAAGTWFWADPTNHVVFVGMIQRMFGLGTVNLGDATERVVDASINRVPVKP